MLKLWLVSQRENTGYDTFDGFVVAAEDEASARKTHPYDVDGVDSRNWHSATWASSPDGVTAREIGIASPGTKPGTIIISSFNAG